MPWPLGFRPTASTPSSRDDQGTRPTSPGWSTVAALTATGKADQRTFHFDYARQNGVTEEELKEAILHLSFYTGWPTA
ncbi:carboxymuconolactone decarboxylase family protein [Arthrobacter sp. AK01]|nr:carboxymuconolactone decarboxylase family protein [Arthrobacter sp. AK01]